MKQINYHVLTYKLIFLYFLFHLDDLQLGEKPGFFSPEHQYMGSFFFTCSICVLYTQKKANKTELTFNCGLYLLQLYNANICTLLEMQCTVKVEQCTRDGEYTRSKRNALHCNTNQLQEYANFSKIFIYKQGREIE